MPDRRVLVTGAGGFIGCCVVRRLLASGDEVHVLLRQTCPWRLRDVLPRIRTHPGDLRRADDVRRAIRAARPEIVVHCAAYGAYESQYDSTLILETVVLGTAHLIQAAENGGVRLLVNMGSSSEYGFRGDVMAEHDRLDPNSTYAVAKAAQTHLCMLAAREGRLPAVTFRLFSVFGPWEEPTRLFPTIIRRALAGLPLEMVGREVARDFVYVEDALDVMLDFARLVPFSGEVFNVASGRQSTLAEVIAALETALGRTVDVRWGTMPARRWDTTTWCADVTKIRDALGWAPRHDLVSGVRSFLEWWPGAESVYAAVTSI